MMRISFDKIFPSRAKLYFGFVSMMLMLTMCTTKKEEVKENTSSINTAHLDALYEEKIVGEDTVGIVHIYAEHPAYQWKGDDDEGIACVDDASRAAIFYLRQYVVSLDPEHLRKGKMLLRFLLAMQAPNGYYYNFIWPDGSIHTDGMTSKPEPNFWSWRTLWAFGVAIDVLENSDPLKAAIQQQREVLVGSILKEKAFRSTLTDTTMGWTFPIWLPKFSGTDQAAIVIIGLSDMIRQSTTQQIIPNDTLIEFVRHFADGIVMMQIEQPDSLQDGAFLSWENLWHAYANIQSYALLTAGQVLDDPHMIAHGLYEVDHFYPAILKAGGLDHFSIKVVDGKLVMYNSSTFSQIAYGRRPMIWAAAKAYELTSDEKYLGIANELTEWFHGKNPANIPMYDPSTGRGYDGIIDHKSINQNAGAESTIESLLSLQTMEHIASKR